MKFLIVGLKENPQLKRLQEEGKKRHHQVDGCLASDLIIKAESESFEVNLKKGRDLKGYDLLYLWAMGQRRWEWAMTAYFLNWRYQTRIVNQKMIQKDYGQELFFHQEYLITI